jgi:ribosome-binding protein aMBF1 (putative translation factor)
VDKSITSQEYRVFLRALRAARRRTGLTQVDLADRLGETQSFVSKCERGERRLDIVEVRSFCRAFGVSLAAFALQLDRTLTNASRSTAKRPRP